MRCANCKQTIAEPDCGSESSVYSPYQSFTLCEPCWLEEDAEIDTKGTNELPHRIARYRSDFVEQQSEKP